MISSKTAATLFKALLQHWFRYFGPPRILTSDQEGGIKAEETALACDRFSIVRNLAGSQGHTITGLAERHIQITKLTMLKLDDDIKREGLKDISREDIGFESGMAANLTLEYGGYTPCQCVMGSHPRGWYETETDSLVAVSGAAESSPDLFEQALRTRMLARGACQKAILEDRLAEANKTRVQKTDLSQLKANETQVDLFRLPDSKSESGWRGPCDLLHIGPDSAIVRHQGVPYIVPLRDIRKHVLLTMLYSYALSSSYFLTRRETWHVSTDQLLVSLTRELFDLMDIVDGQPEGKTRLHGAVYNEDNSIIWIPPELENGLSSLATLASKVASDCFQMHDISGIRFCTQPRRLYPLPRCNYGQLLMESTTTRRLLRAGDQMLADHSSRQPTGGLVWLQHHHLLSIQRQHRQL